MPLEGVGSLDVPDHGPRIGAAHLIRNPRRSTSRLDADLAPVDKEMAGQIEVFIADWQTQQRQKAAQ